MKKFAILLSLGTLALMSITAKAEVSELRIPLGAGGFGFLPLHIMKKYQLIEKKAAEAGFKLTINWANVGGPSVMNDALLSGSADFISAGPPAFLILWDRTKSSAKVRTLFDVITDINATGTTVLLVEQNVKHALRTCKI